MQSYTDLICQHCQKPFKALTKEVKRGRKYCCYPCAVPNIPGATPKPMEERFWSKVRKTDSCWLWTAYRDKDGYGRFDHIPAHVVSWEIRNGPVPTGMLVCHNCPGGDCTSCVNPEHLFLGTYKDNSIDAVRKGTVQRGESHFRCKVNDQDVIELRKMANTGESFESIGRRFGITGSTARKIIFRTSRKHIP